MPQVINTNVASLNAQRNLNTSQMGLATSLQRLSSGLRINSAKDDAAGLAISERMTAQIRGLDQARRNANDGVSLAQTGEGALAQMGDMLQRIRELAVQSNNASNTANDRQSLNGEMGQLVQELDRFAQTTQFNGLNLLDGTMGSATFQVGANANQTISTATASFRTTSYGTNQVQSSGVGVASTYNQVQVTTGAVGTSGGLVFGAGTVNYSSSLGSGAVTITTADSAKTIAASINAQSQTGIKATARTEADITFQGAGATSGYAMQVWGGTNATSVSGASISFNVTANSATGLADAISAFNNVSSQTGVTAKLSATGNGVDLTADDGSTIMLGNTGASGMRGGVTVSGAINAGYSAAAASFSGGIAIGGAVTLDSSRSYTVSGSTVSGYNTSGGVASSSLQTVATLDITTTTGSTKAIRIVDAALDTLNSQRAVFGALQSRFDNTIANLQTASENLSAARSRIRDTDFAAETANMTRSQILQQAGVAMLAQANALPNSVLSLLK